MYQLSVAVHDMGSSAPPALQSYVTAQIGDEWLLLAGRTNGLHNFTNDGLLNFPPASQNTTAYVINPLTRSVWSRSLQDIQSGLSPVQIAALSSTAPQFTQIGSRLYVNGGYVYSGGAFSTFSTLTAVDAPQAISWIKGGPGTLAAHLRQTSDPLLQVTGGSLHMMNGRAHLIFGQNFDGPYNPNSNGFYTQQVRSFDLVDNGVTLSIANPTATTPDPNFRRRDHNVVPILTNGGTTPGVVALSGVFTLGGGAWTVPVEIAADGTPTMADPTAPSTFKQGLNGYKSATIPLYSAQLDQSHSIALGGISGQYVSGGAVVTDSNLPFNNTISDTVRDSLGNYTQFYLGDLPSIPNILNGGAPFLFGAASDFMPTAGLPLTSNGMIDFDALMSFGAPTVIGYVFGGIAAAQPNFGSSGASDVMFAVTFTPVPEPSTIVLLILGSIGGLVFRVRRQLHKAACSA